MFAFRTLAYAQLVHPVHVHTEPHLRPAGGTPPAAVAAAAGPPPAASRWSSPRSWRWPWPPACEPAPPPRHSGLQAVPYVKWCCRMETGPGLIVLVGPAASSRQASGHSDTAALAARAPRLLWHCVPGCRGLLTPTTCPQPQSLPTFPTMCASIRSRYLRLLVCSVAT